MTTARETFFLLGPYTPPLLYAATLVACMCMVVGFRRLLGRFDLAEAWRTREGAPTACLRRLVRLVVLQQRVARTARGWMHVLLVGALVALAIGTFIVFLDWDLARPLGKRWLQGDPYFVFGACMDTAGVLLLGGVTGALLSRWRQAPLPSPRIHREFVLVLCALLFIGGTGFVLEGMQQALRGHADPGRFVGAWLGGQVGIPFGTATYSCYVALWWTHALAALALLAAVPYSVLAHAALASLQALVSSDEPVPAASTPFDLRVLLEQGQFDMPVGARHASEFGARHKLSFLSCTGCGRCDDACPSHAGGGRLSPRSLVLELQDTLQRGPTPGDGSTGSRPPVPANGGADAIWACTACGACASACPSLVRPAEAVLEMRRARVADFRLPPPQAETLARLERCGNPYGVAPSERAGAPRRLGLPTLREVPEPEVLYWLGCAGACDNRTQRVVLAVAALLRAAGVRFATLGEDEACCGDVARRLGEEGRFQMLALQNIEVLRAAGVTRLLSHCPHCFNTLRNEYPTLGGEFTVQHHTEFLADLLAAGKLAAPPPGEKPEAAVTALHDPCWLARQNLIVAPPRQILQAALGRVARELPEAGTETRCCGGGAGNYFCDEGGGTTGAAARRLAQATAQQVTRLATACPYCLRMLEGAPREGEHEVRDVAEILAEALGLDTGGAGGKT